ncbi:MAG: hypothetical protein IJ735_05290 [Clostridia bacterium]|nr:hypothetical protein [Clostridia bacterium]
MSEEKTLRYTVNEDEYVFFYGEEILFANSKSNPFLYVTIEKEGVKKELPLSDCNITKTDENGYKIKFYNRACAVNVKINLVKNTVYFEFTKLGLFGELLSINLFLKNAKIKGMGLNPYKDIRGFYCDKNGFFNQKEYSDVRAAFSIKNGFFFKNESIEDFRLFFYGRSVKINTRQNKGSFLLEFDKKYYFEDGKKDVLLFCNPKEAEKISAKDDIYDGFIVPYEDSENYEKTIKTVRKRNFSFLVRISPELKEEEKDFSQYEKEGLIKTKYGFVIDSTNETNVRLFKNKIRKILDKNVEGIYLDERDIVIQEEKKYPYIGRALHDAIHAVCREYPAKKIIYNKLYSDEKNNETYSVEFEKISKKESDYKKALTYSEIEKTYYEISRKKYEKSAIKNNLILIK